jgi:DNA polymerase-3 subunit alpha
MTTAHAEGIFDLMEKFAGYGFNKSHSAAYALLSYQTAWLKTHYPAPFMAAVLSSDMDNTDKVVTLIDECRAMRLTVEPPDVNRSAYQFRARDERSIVYGLGAVKGVGQSAIEALIEERERSGAYSDLYDLCRRSDLRRLNRRVLEALIRSGSLDSLTPNRASAMQALPEALKAAEQQLRDQETGQDDLFGLGPATATVAAGDSVSEHVPTVPEWEEQERLAAEKETLGLYLTGHPIDQYERELEGIVTARLKQVATGSVGGRAVTGGNGNGRREKGVNVVVAGLVMAVRVRNTQSGSRLAVVTLDDRTGRIEVVVFSEAFNRFRHLLVKDQLLVVEGELGYDDFSDGYRISAERVLGIGEAREQFARRLVLGVRAAQAGNGFIPSLRETLEPFREGNCPVWLEYRSEQATAELCLDQSWRVRPTDELIKRLGRIVDAATIRLEY